MSLDEDRAIAMIDQIEDAMVDAAHNTVDRIAEQGFARSDAEAMMLTASIRAITLLAQAYGLPREGVLAAVQRAIYRSAN